MDNDKWEPWKQYPDIWATKSKFFTFLRGALRKAVWNQSPIKITYKNGACSAPPVGYEGRAKSGAYCALSGEWEGKSKLDVDHISGNVSLNDEADILDFIKHLIPPPNSLQLVKKDAHKIKSYAEKQGISYELAVATKEAIRLVKEKSDYAWLLEHGIQPSKSSALRRKQIIEEIMK